MKCKICEKEIEKYNPTFNTLQVDGKTVDVCSSCVDQFTKWRGEIFAKLFPTKQMKERYDK